LTVDRRDSKPLTTRGEAISIGNERERISSGLRGTGRFFHKKQATENGRVRGPIAGKGKEYNKTEEKRENRPARSRRGLENGYQP